MTPPEAAGWIGCGESACTTRLSTAKHAALLAGAATREQIAQHGGRPIGVDIVTADERSTHLARGGADHRINSVLSIPIAHRDDIERPDRDASDPARPLRSSTTVTCRGSIPHAARPLEHGGTSAFPAATEKLFDRGLEVHERGAFTCYRSTRRSLLGRLRTFRRLRRPLSA
jgi:hypothetical protein